VLLQVMALARDVADDLEAVGQPHLGHLAQGGIGLLRRRRIDARAHPALLRTLLQRRNLVAGLHLHPRLADQLIDRRHPALTFNVVSWRTTRPRRLSRKTKARHALVRAMTPLDSEDRDATDVAVMHPFS